jgi:hypothetical protein
MLATPDCSAAIAARVSNPVSFLHVSAHVDATPAATRNCRLPISVLIGFMTFSSFLQVDKKGCINNQPGGWKASN